MEQIQRMQVPMFLETCGSTFHTALCHPAVKKPKGTFFPIKNTIAIPDRNFLTSLYTFKLNTHNQSPRKIVFKSENTRNV